MRASASFAEVVEASGELAADLGGDTATLGSPGDGRLRRLHGRPHLRHAANPPLASAPATISATSSSLSCAGR